MSLTRILFRATFVVYFLVAAISVKAVIRDGGIDPANLGKGEWIYSMTDATNRVGGHVASVTNETSLMLFYRSVGVRYMIVKAATSDQLFRGCYNKPQFSSNLCNIARANGILIFGYNRSYGANVPGELAVIDYIFQQGADGFVYDAEAEWESQQPWIGTNGPSLAWQLCSTARSNWPNKFFAHAPFPIIYLHSSFPYKEFGYWCDAVMPQIYHFSSAGLKRSPSACINWSDVNWKTWQDSLTNLPPVVKNGLPVYWTNAIKPITPLQDVYGEIVPGGVICEGTANPYPDKDVMEFIDYSLADPHAQTVGGYKGINFWRTDLQGTNQWAYVSNGSSGDFVGVVNNIVIDDPRSTSFGGWTPVKVFGATTTTPTYFGATGSDTNSFGTNYLRKTKGAGNAWVEFTPNIVVAGDYNVYQWHPFVTNASAGTPFRITHARGTNTVFADQRTNDGDWTLLGKFYFTNGTSGKIRVLDNLLDGGTVAIADGVKLVFVPPTNAPAPPSGLNATPLNSAQVRLTWNDLATNELVYVIARSQTNSGPYADVGAVTANTTIFTNIGLTANTTYHYRLRATNAAGSTISIGPVAATTPYDLPVFVSQPQSQSVFPNQSATFSASAAGSVPLGYQWNFDGVPIASATNTTYQVNSADTADIGHYSVTASNPAGSVTSSNAALALQSIVGAGNNAFGQRTVPPLNGAIAVAAGEWHSLALQEDGHVTAWGYNFDGQCTVPVDVTNAMAIAAGGYHSLALRMNGTAIGWGANDYGQRTAPANLKNVTGIAAGTWHSVALKTDGTVVAWGDNTWGQTNIPPGLTGVIAIAAGGNHSLALKSNGTVVAWGQNENANGLFVGQSVVPPGLNNVIGIAAGTYHSLAVKNDGYVVPWGDNSQGQSTIIGGLSNIVACAAGGTFSLALRVDGTLFGWGDNSNGQMTFSPQTTNVVALAAGNSHSIVLLDDASFPAPQLLSLTLSGGKLNGFIPTIYRKKYAVESQTSLLNGAWFSFNTNSGNGALLRFQDANATSSTKFYRVRRW